MWKVLCLLGVLAVPLKSHHLLRRDIRGLNNRDGLEKVHYSYSVPIWQYSPDNLICEQPGYFPDPQHCQYFYKCTVGHTDHLFRFVYRCENGRVYSADTNRCVEATESNLVCAETPKDESSMEVEDNQAEPNQQTSDEITVKKPSSQDDPTNEGEEKQTPAENLAAQSDGRAVNAPTEKPVTIFSIRTPDSIKLPKLELNVSVEKKVPSFQGIKNTGQLFDGEKVDEETVPVQNKPQSIPEQQTILPPIPQLESDEKDEEVPTTRAPILTTTLPSISETEEDRTAAAEVQTGRGQPITSSFTTLHGPELKEPTDNTQEVADQSVCYDGKNSSDCVDEAFYGVPEDCAKFYRCVSLGSHFVKYELQCPFGTIWDDSLKTCNFHAAIKEITCKDKSLPATPTPPTFTTATASTTPPASSDDSDTDCPFDDIPEDSTGIICPTGFREHPKYCNMFYQCISTDNFEMNFTSLVCPDDMVFNVERLHCETNETRRQSCRNFEPITKQDDGQILIKSNLELCPEEGRFIYGERCSSRYIECLRDEHGKLEGYLLRCPRGMMYSRVRDNCRPSSFFNHCPALN